MKIIVAAVAAVCGLLFLLSVGAGHIEAGLGIIFAAVAAAL